MVNWDRFKAKFKENVTTAFENLTYYLFCNEFNNGEGLFRYKNQKCIETEPIRSEFEIIGFQTKFFEVSPSERVNEFIHTIECAKKTYELTKLVFYVYPESGQSSKKHKTKTAFIEKVEDEAKKYGMEIIWKFPSLIEQDLSKPQNRFLCHEYFDVEFEGIYDINSFIELKRNKRKPNLKNSFYKMDNCFNEVVNKIRDSGFIAISGNPMMGKTRLALEVSKTLCKENDYNIIIITRQSYNLVSNIKKVLAYEKINLLIFDDYKENYKNLPSILEEIRYSAGHDKVKFLFTLKKQHLDMLTIQLHEFDDIANIQLIPILDEDMREIINIASRELKFYLKSSPTNKILEISKGNVGICMMVLTSIKNNDLKFLDNYHHIYKLYFDDLELNSLTNENKILLGILSFFNQLDFNNIEFINHLDYLSDYALSQNEFIDEMVNKELLEFEDETLYITDPILSAYMFYLVFIDEKLLKLQDFIEEFLQLCSSQLKYNIYVTVTIFGINSIKNIKVNQLDNVIKNLDDNQLISFLNIFYLCFPEKIISLLNNWIKNEFCEEFDFTDWKLPKIRRVFGLNSKITLLSLLFHTKYSYESLQLALKILIKKPSLKKDILYYIKENYSFTLSGAENDFIFQNEFMDFVEQDSFNDIERLVLDKIFLFLLSENNLFRWRHHEFKHNVVSKGLGVIRFDLSSGKSLINLRSRILTHLFSIYESNSSEVQDIFEQYVGNISRNHEDIFVKEQELVYNFFKTLDFKKYNSNRLCYLYLENINKNRIELGYDFNFMDKELVNRVKIYSNAFNRFDRRHSEEIYQEIMDDFDEEYDVISILELMRDIKKYESSSEVYCNLLFNVLLEKDFSMFLEGFLYYLNNNLNLINRYYFIEHVFDKMDAIEFYNFINSSKHQNKNSLNYYYFELIPKQYLTKEIFSMFIEFLNYELTGIDLYHIKKFYKFDDYFFDSDLKTETNNIVQYIIQIILEKFNEIKIQLLFDFCKDNCCYFKDNFELIKTFYLTCLESEYYDYDNGELETLCMMNKEFIKEYFDWRLEHILDIHNDAKIDFIWKLDYEFDYIDDLIKLIVEKCEFFYLDYVNLLFSNKHEKEQEFIKFFIKKNSHNSNWIRVIFELIKLNYDDEYFGYLKEFITQNNDIEIFKYIINSSYGAEIVFGEMFDKSKIDFYKKIKVMLREFDGDLNYFEHRDYVNELMSESKRELDYEFSLIN